MSRWLLTGVLLVLPGLLAAADDKSKSSSSSSTAKPDAPKERLVPAGQILGEIVKLNEDSKSFTLRMHQKVPQISFNNMYRPSGG